MDFIGLPPYPLYAPSQFDGLIVCVVSGDVKAPPPVTSTRLWRGRMIIFGGATTNDAHAHALGDLWSLDLSNLAWYQPRTRDTPPMARCCHTE